jgi:hypothetical protein
LKLALQNISDVGSTRLLLSDSDEVAQVLYDANLVGEVGRKLRPVDGHLLEAVDFLVQERLTYRVLQQELLDTSKSMRYLHDLPLDGQAILGVDVVDAMRTFWQISRRFLRTLRVVFGACEEGRVVSEVEIGVGGVALEFAVCETRRIPWQTFTLKLHHHRDFIIK